MTARRRFRRRRGGSVATGWSNCRHHKPMASLKDVNCPGFTAQPSNPNRCLHCRKGIGRHRAVRLVRPEPTLGIAARPVDSSQAEAVPGAPAQERGYEESVDAAGRRAGSSAVAVPFVWPRHRSRANYETFEVIVSLSEFDWGRLGPHGVVGSWTASTSHSPRHWPRGAWFVYFAADGPLEIATPPPQRLSVAGRNMGVHSGTSDRSHISPPRLPPAIDGSATAAVRLGGGRTRIESPGSSRSKSQYPVALKSAGSRSLSGPRMMAPRRRFGGAALAEVAEEEDGDEPATASKQSSPESPSSGSPKRLSTDVPYNESGGPLRVVSSGSSTARRSLAKELGGRLQGGVQHVYEHGPGGKEMVGHRGGETERIRTSSIAKPLRARLGPGSAPERGDLFEGDEGGSAGGRSDGEEEEARRDISQPTWRQPRLDQVVAVSKSPVLRFSRAVPLRMPRSRRMLRATSLRVSLMFVGGPAGSGRPPVEVGSVVLAPTTVLPGGAEGAAARGTRSKAVFLRGNGGFKCVCSCFSRPAGAERRSWLGQRIGGTSLRRSFVVGGAQRDSVLSFREECEESSLGVAIPAALCRVRADGMRRQRERLLLGLDRILPLLRCDQGALDLAGPTQGVRDSGGYRAQTARSEGPLLGAGGSHLGLQWSRAPAGSQNGEDENLGRSHGGTYVQPPAVVRVAAPARPSGGDLAESKTPDDGEVVIDFTARVKAAIDRMRTRNVEGAFEIGAQSASAPHIRRRPRTYHAARSPLVSQKASPMSGRGASDGAQLAPSGSRQVSRSMGSAEFDKIARVAAVSTPSRPSRLGGAERLGQEEKLQPPRPLPGIPVLRVSTRMAGAGWYLMTVRNLLCMLRAQAACIAELDGYAAILAHRYRRACRHQSRHRKRGWGDLGHHSESVTFATKKGIVRPGKQEAWPVAGAPGGYEMHLLEATDSARSMSMPIQDVLARGWIRAISRHRKSEQESSSLDEARLYTPKKGSKLAAAVAEQGGQWYKPSALKASSSLAYLPLNLHLHSMEVYENVVGRRVGGRRGNGDSLFVERIARMKRQAAVRRALEAGSASVDATWGWGVTQFKGMFAQGRKAARRRRHHARRQSRVQRDGAATGRWINGGVPDISGARGAVGIPGGPGNGMFPASPRDSMPPVTLPAAASYQSATTGLGRNAGLRQGEALERPRGNASGISDSSSEESGSGSGSASTGEGAQSNHSKPKSEKRSHPNGECKAGDFNMEAAASAGSRSHKPSALAVAGRVAHLRSIFERPKHLPEGGSDDVDAYALETSRGSTSTTDGDDSGKMKLISRSNASSPVGADERRGIPMLLTDLADVQPGPDADLAGDGRRLPGRSVPKQRQRRGSAVSVESHSSEASGLSAASESSHWSALTFGAAFGGPSGQQDDGGSKLQPLWLYYAAGGALTDTVVGGRSNASVASSSRENRRMARYQSVAVLAQAEIARVAYMLQQHADTSRETSGVTVSQGHGGMPSEAQQPGYRDRLLSHASRRAAGARSTSLKQLRHSELGLGFDGMIRASANLDAVTRAAGLAVLALKRMRLEREQISGFPGTWYTILTMGAPALHAPLPPLPGLSSLANLRAFKCFQSPQGNIPASEEYYPRRYRFLAVPGFAEGPYQGMGGLKTGGLEELRLPLVMGLGLDDSTSCAAFLEAWSMCCVSPSMMAVQKWRMYRAKAEVESLDRRQAWRKWFEQAIAATSRTGEAAAALGPQSPGLYSSQRSMASSRHVGGSSTDMGMYLEALGMGQILGAQGAGEGVAQASLREDQLKRKSDLAAKRTALENLMSTLGAVAVEHGVERSSVAHNSRPTYDSAIPLSQASMAAASVAIALQRREDRVFAQALTAAVALVCSTVDAAIAAQRTSKLSPLAKAGFLVSFESLLSTAGSETGMLRDFKVAVRYLAKVRVRFRYRLGKAQARGAEAIWRISGVHAPGMSGTLRGRDGVNTVGDGVAGDAPRWYAKQDGLNVWGARASATADSDETMTGRSNSVSRTDTATYFHAAVASQVLKQGAARERANARTGTRTGSGDSSHEASTPKNIKRDQTQSAFSLGASGSLLTGTGSGRSHRDLGSGKARLHDSTLPRGTKSNRAMPSTSPRLASTYVPTVVRTATAFATSYAREEDSWSASSDGETGARKSDRKGCKEPQRRSTVMAIPSSLVEHGGDQSREKMQKTQRRSSPPSRAGLSSPYTLAPVTAVAQQVAAERLSESDSDSEGAEMARAIERSQAAQAEAERGFSARDAVKARVEQAEGALQKLTRRLDRKKAMKVLGSHDEGSAASDALHDLSADEVDSESSGASGATHGSGTESETSERELQEQLLTTAESLVRTAGQGSLGMDRRFSRAATGFGTDEDPLYLDSRRVSVLPSGDGVHDARVESASMRDGSRLDYEGRAPPPAAAVVYGLAPPVRSDGAESVPDAGTDDKAPVSELDSGGPRTRPKSVSIVTQEDATHRMDGAAGSSAARMPIVSLASTVAPGAIDGAERKGEVQLLPGNIKFSARELQRVAQYCSWAHVWEASATSDGSDFDVDACSSEELELHEGSDTSSHNVDRRSQREDSFGSMGRSAGRSSCDVAHADPGSQSGLPLESGRGRSQTTLAVIPPALVDRRGQGPQPISPRDVDGEGIVRVYQPKHIPAATLAYHLRDTLPPPPRNKRAARVRWALRRSAERLVSTQVRVVQGTRLAKSPYIGFRHGIEAEAAAALTYASRLAQKKLKERWDDMAGQSAVVRAIVGDGEAVAGARGGGLGVERALQLARYSLARGRTDASAAQAVRRLRGRGRFSVFGQVQGLGAADLADRLRQDRSGSSATARSAVSAAMVLGSSDEEVDTTGHGSMSNGSAAPPDFKWRAIWYDVQPVLAVRGVALPRATMLDNFMSLRLLVLAAGIGGGVGPRLAEAAACLRSLRPADESLQYSGYLQADGVANAHALLSLVSRDKKTGRREGRRVRTDSYEGGTAEGGDDGGDRSTADGELALASEAASASSASLAIREALHMALTRYPYRIAAPYMLPLPPALPRAPVPPASRGTVVPARIRERRQRFSLRGGGIAGGATLPTPPGSPPLSGASRSDASALDPVSVVPPEYLSQVLVQLAAASAEDYQVLQAVQRVQPSLRNLRAAAVAGGHLQGRRAALQVLARLAGIRQGGEKGYGSPATSGSRATSPGKGESATASGGAQPADRASRVKMAQAGGGSRPPPRPPVPKAIRVPDGAPAASLTTAPLAAQKLPKAALAAAAAFASGSPGTGGRARVTASTLKSAPGTELNDLPAFCAAAASDDALQAAVLLANEQALVVDLECKPSVFDQLPAALRESAVPLVPLLFSQGINEAQTFANLQGSSDISLQQETNQASLFRLQQFARRWAGELAGGEMRAIDRDLAALGTEVLAEADRSRRRAKRPRVLQLAGDIVRALGGGRVTCCKSGKDRTAMSVTLEMARVLARRHGLPRARVLETADLLREWGVRRDVCRKCIGKPRFAFNRLQQGFLPEEYQPPSGSIAQSAIET